MNDFFVFLPLDKGESLNSLKSLNNLTLKQKLFLIQKMYDIKKVQNEKEVRGCTLKSSRGLCPPEAISSFESCKHQRMSVIS